MNDLKMKKLAPVILRVGLAMIFTWFGVNQVLSQTMWTSLVPESLVSITGISAATIVLLNGIFEIVMALLLAIGFQIRIVATLLALHLVSIIGSIGLNAVGIRDIGLFFAMISIALQGADAYSYDTPKVIVLS